MTDTTTTTNNYNYNNSNIAESVRLANELSGKIVQICGEGGYLGILADNGNKDGPSSSRNNKQIRTSYHNPGRFEIVKINNIHSDRSLESSGSMIDNSGAIVAFRVVPENEDHNNNNTTTRPDFYLQQVMYGNNASAAILETLRPWTAFPSDDIKSLIVDYAVEKSSDPSNFEGTGFNYTPMIATSANPLTTLHYFYIEPSIIPYHHRSNYHIRSYYGTYWRSQHWDHTITQSHNKLEDESWTITILPSPPPPPVPSSSQQQQQQRRNYPSIRTTKKQKHWSHFNKNK